MRTIRKIISLIIMSAILYCPIYAQNLPTDTSTLFSGSGNCAQCHSAGNAAFISTSGEDVSPSVTWRSTMMANSSKDPLWQAKVSAEVNANPALETIIEDKCNTCHTPMGRTEAIYHNLQYFSFEDALSDQLSLDGVSCTLCHQIQEHELGSENSFSGGYRIMDEHFIFGPYQSPTTMPMFNQVGYTPVYSNHINVSELCATCHTLFTPYVDNQGEIGGYFPEQTPYLEWKNSVYSSTNIECQSCHMPTIEESMKISSRPMWLTTLRSPIWKHDFVGGNLLLHKIFREFRDEIEINASYDHLDSTSSKTLALLNEKTVNLSFAQEIFDDTLEISVKIENLTGHKFPTGFPSRLSWLHVLVKNQEDNTIFESGNWDENGEIIGVDEEFEPHHQTIRHENQVQIYQSLMQDVDGNVTYTLLRGSEYIKDNRIPPKGFRSDIENYEDIAIIGNANNDPDFNLNSTGLEGTGADEIVYKIPISELDQQFNVKVELRYQTVSPGFLNNLFSYSQNKVMTFKQYYNSIDVTPILIKSLSGNITKTNIKQNIKAVPQKYGLMNNYPNPFNASTIIEYLIKAPSYHELYIYNINGRKVKTLYEGTCPAGEKKIVWDGRDNNSKNAPSGIYICCIKFNDEIYTKRMVLLR